MIGGLLCMLARFSLLMELNVASIFLLGEYPYPTEEDYI